MTEPDAGALGDHDLLGPGSAVEPGYAAALDHLGRLLLDADDLDHVLVGVVEGVRLAVPSLAAVSVTTVDEHGAFTTAFASDARARAVDELEYREHAGPCVDAHETGELQVATDVRSDDRWPAFNDLAEEQGFLSVAGVPLAANGTVYGALNLFADRPGGIDDATLDLCRRLAPSVGATLANARAYATMDRLSAQLGQRLADLAVLHQAVGILMAERGCDARAATVLLHRTAEATERTVRDVAEQIVGSVTDAGGAVPGSR